MNIFGIHRIHEGFLSTFAILQYGFLEFIQHKCWQIIILAMSVCHEIFTTITVRMGGSPSPVGPGKLVGLIYGTFKLSHH